MGGGGSHSHTLSISSAGGHEHPVSVSLGDSGAGDPHENRPPYYSVAFIMLA
jgi:microcystin-dependent protein